MNSGTLGKKASRIGNAFSDYPVQKTFSGKCFSDWAWINGFGKCFANQSGNIISGKTNYNQLTFYFVFPEILIPEMVTR